MELNPEETRPHLFGQALAPSFLYHFPSFSSRIKFWRGEWRVLIERSSWRPAVLGSRRCRYPQSNMASAQRGDGHGIARLLSGPVEKILPKPGSFDNIEELAEALISTKSRTCPSAEKEARRGKSPGAPQHAARARRSRMGEADCDATCAEVRPERRGRSWLACEGDDDIATVALPPSHSRWLFAVSWMSILVSMQCAYYGLWDVLCVPLGVGLNSLNYWRRPDYGWRRYLDIVYVQFAIPFSSYKALHATEPYRTAFFVCLFLGISSFANACRLCSRPASGSWREFLDKHPRTNRQLKWSTANHFLLHIMCNVGNAALFMGLSAARS